MGRDSNPRYLAVHTLSRRAQSTTLAPIQLEPETLERQVSSFNKFSRSNGDSDKVIEKLEKNPKDLNLI